MYERTPSLVKSRVENIVSALSLSPTVAYNASDISNILFGTVDSGLVELQIFETLYEPTSTAFATFEALKALEQGDALPIFSGSVKADNDNLAQCGYNASEPFVSGFLDVSAPIACGDILGQTGTFREVKQGYEEMRENSAFADVWFPLSEGRCA